MNFVDFAADHGVLINRLNCGEKVFRCGTTTHPRSTNGAYTWDGERGWVFAWDGDAQVHWYGSKDKPWTEAEKAAWRAKKQAAERAKDAEHARASRRAQQMVATAKPDVHDYLARKGFPDTQGLVLPTGDLFVPMRSLGDNRIVGGQVIHWNQQELTWEKKMLPGMKAKGAIFRIGSKYAPETVFCEGYATGLSIEAAARSVGLSVAVLVTFSATNLVYVAGVTSGKRYVFADNDVSKTGETSAKATGLPYCMSPVEGEDANDLMARAGKLAVAQLLMNVRRQEMAMS